MASQTVRSWRVLVSLNVATIIVCDIINIPTVMKAWCKTIVTTLFYITSYNSFAPSSWTTMLINWFLIVVPHCKRPKAWLYLHHLFWSYPLFTWNPIFIPHIWLMIRVCYYKSINLLYMKSLCTLLWTTWKKIPPPKAQGYRFGVVFGCSSIQMSVRPSVTNFLGLYLKDYNRFEHETLGGIDLIEKCTAHEP